MSQTSSDRQPLYVSAAQNGLSGVRFDGVNDYFVHTTGHTFTNATMIVVTKLANIDFLDSTNLGGGAVSIQQSGVDNFDAIVYHEHTDADRKFMHMDQVAMLDFIQDQTR